MVTLHRARRAAFFAAALASVLAARSFAAVGIFDGSLDLGRPGDDPKGLGSATYDSGTGVYTVVGGGSDWWDGGEFGHFAYVPVSGDFRLQATVTPINDGASDWWAKYGIAVRSNIDTGAGNEKAVNYIAAVTGPRDAWNHKALLQYRPTATSNMTNIERDWWKEVTPGNWESIQPQKVALERRSFAGKNLISAFADFGQGGGWTHIATVNAPELPDNAYVGLALTSHTNDPASTNGLTETATYSDVALNLDPFPAPAVVPAGTRVTGDLNALSDPGMKIRVIKDGRSDHNGWGWAQMNELLNTGAIGGTPGVQAGDRIASLVNLYDTGDRGAFKNDNGKPDETFPGIDPFISDPTEPANGTDDDHFATEISGYIALTAGEHIIGINSDDGVILWIGGVEVGRTGEWKGTSNEDIYFTVAEAGVYSFRARGLEGGGGASLELHDYDGVSRVLLGEGSLKLGQTVPEPGTLSLLLVASGFALVRRRRA